MADLGTMGNALAASQPITGEDIKPIVQKRIEADEREQQRLQELDKRSDALRPPEYYQPPQMPQVQDTPPEQRWGSAAMWLAAFGGLLTRQPMTTSLNAMAAVNQAFNAGDETRHKHALEQWKVASENARRFNEFQVNAYRDSLDKINSDRNTAIAGMKATAAALQDRLVLQLIETGHVDEAVRILLGRSQQTPQEQEAADDYHRWQDYLQQQTKAYKEAHEGHAPPPEVVEQWRGEFTKMGKKPGATPSKSAGDEAAIEKAIAELREKYKHEHGGKEPTAEDELNFRHEAEQKLTKDPALTAKDKLHQHQIELWKLDHPNADPETLRHVEAEINADRDPDAKENIGNPETLEITREVNGKTVTERVVAQHNKATGGWQRADETKAQIPLAGVKWRIVKGTESPAARSADEFRVLATAALEKRLGRRVDPDDPDDKVELIKEEKKQRIADAAETAEARATAQLRAHAAEEKWDEDSIRALVADFRLTGKIPYAVMAGSQVVKQQFAAEWGRQARNPETIADDISRRSSRHALEQALNTLGRSRANVSNYEATALKELNQVREMVEKGAAGANPYVNRWIQAGRRAIQGDPDVEAFNAYMLSFKNEYARIMSSPNATGGQTTDAARNEAESMINISQTPEQLAAVLDAMKTGMDNRIRSINEEYAATENRIKELNREVTGGGTKVPATDDAPVISTKSDYDNLPAGAHFRKPDDPPGSFRTKQ